MSRKMIYGPNLFEVAPWRVLVTVMVLSCVGALASRFSVYWPDSLFVGGYGAGTVGLILGAFWEKKAGYPTGPYSRRSKVLFVVYVVLMVVLTVHMYFEMGRDAL